jgi:hypothetical protein
MAISREDREAFLQRRAYQLWEDAGLREGDELTFWLMAEEMEAAEDDAGDPALPQPSRVILPTEKSQLPALPNALNA